MSEEFNQSSISAMAELRRRNILERSKERLERINSGYKAASEIRSSPASSDKNGNKALEKPGTPKASRSAVGPVTSQIRNISRESISSIFSETESNTSNSIINSDFDDDRSLHEISPKLIFSDSVKNKTTSFKKLGIICEFTRLIQALCAVTCGLLLSDFPDQHNISPFFILFTSEVFLMVAGWCFLQAAPKSQLYQMRSLDLQMQFDRRCGMCRIPLILYTIPILGSGLDSLDGLLRCFRALTEDISIFVVSVAIARALSMTL